MWLGFFTGFSVCLVFPKKIRKRGSQVYKYDYQKNQKWAESARRAPAGSHEWGLWHHHALRLGPEMYSLGLSFFVTMQAHHQPLTAPSIHVPTPKLVFCVHRRVADARAIP